MQRLDVFWCARRFSAFSSIVANLRPFIGFLSFGNNYDPFEQIRIIIDVILLMMCWGIQSEVRHWHLLGHLGRACTTYKLFFTQSGITVCHCLLIISIFDTKFDAISLIHFFYSRKSPSTPKYV